MKTFTLPNGRKITVDDHETQERLATPRVHRFVPARQGGPAESHGDHAMTDTRYAEITSSLKAHLFRMSAAEIAEYWRERQIRERAAGRHAYTKLVDVATGEVVATT